MTVVKPSRFSGSGLLALGTSLMVYSSFRFCRRAAEQDTPVAIVNEGVTRADDLAELKVEGEVSATLQALCRRLGIRPPAAGAVTR